MTQAQSFDAAPSLPRSVLTLSFESGETSLEVRRFEVEEGLSHLFTLTITAVSPNPDLDLATLVGRSAAFSAATGVEHALVGRRAWSGICRAMDLVRVEAAGLSTYELTLVPTLWRLTQRRNHRLFQHVGIPDIVDTLLGEWSIEPSWRVARGDYPKLELRVQYGESDYDFLSRLLEEAGITFSFAEGSEAGSTQLVLDDRPQGGTSRAAALPFRDSPGQAAAARVEYVTAARLHEEVRPARQVVRDFDYRRPQFRLEGTSAAEGGLHPLMEQYHYRPGSALAEVGEAGGTPAADDKGMARHDDKVGQAFAQRGLQALRGPRRVVRFETNALDLAPGVIFSLADHPRGELGPAEGLLVTRIELEGVEGEPWRMRGKAVFAKEPYQPAPVTPKPSIHGVQSALVVGPDGQEIYTDEFGRIRVQFHWDREGDNNDDSSVWMRVVYNASGPGYGIVSIPRVGHEVILAFMEGDPDLPIVVGSTYNATSPVPYELPDNKTVSTWKAASSPGGDGFNEVKMENKAGHELLYQQAEKDMAVLVKNDEVHMVGHDRSVMVEHDEVKSVKNDRTHVVQHDERTAVQNDRVEQVGHDEHVGVGNDRVHQIKANDTLGVGKNHVVQVGKSAVLAVGEDRSVHVGKDEQVSVGQDQSVSVGQSRSTSVGINDALQVGSRYTVTVSNGLTGKLASALGGVLDGGALASLSKVVGPFATGPLQQIVGKLAKTSIGATPLAKLIQGPAAALQEVLPGPLKSLGSMVSGQIDALLGDLFGVSGGPPTTFDMVDKKITLTTGDASIVLDGGKIILQAKEGIFVTSAEVGVQGAVKVEIVAGMHPIAAAAAGQVPPPAEIQGALLLSGMKELAAISPQGKAFLGAKEAVLVACEAETEVVGKKGAKLLSTEGDAVVVGKTVQLNPPAKAKKKEEPEPKPNDETKAPEPPHVHLRLDGFEEWVRMRNGMLVAYNNTGNTESGIGRGPVDGDAIAAADPRHGAVVGAEFKKALESMDPDAVVRDAQFLNGFMGNFSFAYQPTLQLLLKLGKIDRATYDELTADTKAQRAGSATGTVASIAFAWVGEGAPFAIKVGSKVIGRLSGTELTALSYALFGVGGAVTTPDDNPASPSLSPITEFGLAMSQQMAYHTAPLVDWLYTNGFISQEQHDDATATTKASRAGKGAGAIVAASFMLLPDKTWAIKLPGVPVPIKVTGAQMLAIWQGASNVAGTVVKPSSGWTPPPMPEPHPQPGPAPVRAPPPVVPRPPPPVRHPRKGKK